MGVLTKYDQIKPIYLPQGVVTYIYLHPEYRQQDQECDETEECVNYITNQKTDKKEKWQ
jgi:hypothetical protein